MTELRLPIRGNKGVQLDYYCGGGQGGQLPPFYSQVIKSRSIPTTGDNTASSEQHTLYATKLGKLTNTQYRHTHEELEKLHFIIRCSSFNHQEVTTEENFIRKLPPVVRWCNDNIGTRPLHFLQECCCAMLHFNAKDHLSQRESHFSPFSLYPPNPVNRLHMFTRGLTNQTYTMQYISHLINPNAMLHNEMNHEGLLQTQPQIKTPTK